MPKVNKQGSQPSDNSTTGASTTGAGATHTTATTGVGKKAQVQQASVSSMQPVQPPPNRGKQVGKSSRSQIGGTAIQGAKSTQPRQVTSSNPQQQQAESYNRQMRRRMEHMGTTPSQNTPAQKRQRKRLEKRERQREEVKKVAATGPREILIGRKVVYFLIAVAVLIVALIVIAVLVNHPF